MAIWKTWLGNLGCTPEGWADVRFLGRVALNWGPAPLCLLGLGAMDSWWPLSHGQQRVLAVMQSCTVPGLIETFYLALVLHRLS